jgi:hypothetical protein
MTKLRVTFNQLRQFRNRVFHHEPIWPKRSTDLTPKNWYDVIHQVLRWLGGEQAQIATRLHGHLSAFDDTVAVPAMQARLLDAIDNILAQARTKRLTKEGA